MKNEEIVKELREVIDCIANEELKTATRMALTIIEKLTPKPLFKVGPAKTTGDNLVVIHEIHEGFIFGRIMNIPDKWFSHSWLDSGIDRFGCPGYNLLPNNEPELITDFPFPKPEALYDEKVYGPQKCNETVKTCETCEHENSVEMCLDSYCHDRDRWVPKPTTGKQWDKVKAIEKAHRDAADSKLNFRATNGST